jgi:hypothetical protein
MPDRKMDHRPEGIDYPIAEDAAAVRHGVAERATTFVLRPSSVSEADMLREIDAIQERLRVGIPQLHREMDALLARVRTPGSL